MDEIFDLIDKEEKRQRGQIHLIPSENVQSEAVRRAVGSVLANKYAEGYAGRRYYQGNGVVEEIENLAIEKGKKLLGVPSGVLAKWNFHFPFNESTFSDFDF